MPPSLHLRVLTQAGVAFEEDAVSIIVPGELGYLGILRRHAPLVTTLKPGKLTWRRPSGERRLRHVGSGLLEVVRDHVTMLTDAVSELREAPAGRAAVSAG